MARLKGIVGIGLLAASIAFYIASIGLAVEGYVIASLIGATVGSVTMIVGADLLKES
ncbi:MAG: hypothetical protein F7C33_05695 [Desulfurococcales archaeon]|nr:hypothetical protein [Desulfurococcales archaeon]